VFPLAVLGQIYDLRWGDSDQNGPLRKPTGVAGGRQNRPATFSLPPPMTRPPTVAARTTPQENYTPRTAWTPDMMNTVPMAARTMLTALMRAVSDQVMMLSNAKNRSLFRGRILERARRSIQNRPLGLKKEDPPVLAPIRAMGLGSSKGKK
jgi:hypothetical protein